MKTLKAVRGNRRIVYETLPTGTRMINWRCWSSPFYLRLWVKNNLKISLLLSGVVIVVYTSAFFSSFFRQDSNDLHSAVLHEAHDERSFSSEFELSTRLVETLHIIAPYNLVGSASSRSGMKTTVWRNSNAGQEQILRNR